MRKRLELTQDAKEFYSGAINFINDLLTKDEQDTFFLVKELNLLRNVAKEVKYENLIARDLFPFVSGLGAGLETISYEVYDMQGKAGYIEGASDIPKVNAKRKENKENVRTIASSYSINMFEMERALRSGRNLEQRKLLAALRVLENELDKVAFYGDKEHGLNGLLSKPTSLEIVTIVADGSGSSKKWATKTADKIERDINDMLRKIPDEFMNMPLTLLLSPANYMLLNTIRINNTAISLREYILQNTDISRIEKTSKLKAVPTMSNKEIGVLFVNNPEVLELVVPRDREQRAPFRDGRELVTDVVMDISGMHIYHPKSIVVTDEI